MSDSNFDYLGNQPAGAGHFTTLTTSSSVSIGGDATLTSSDSGSLAGPLFTMVRNSNSAASADLLGAITYTGTNSSGSLVTYSFIESRIDNPVAGLHSGSLLLGTAQSAAIAPVMTLGGGVQVGSPTGGDLGPGTLNATGLFIDGASVVQVLASIPVRQTVISGPVDANGLPSFGGSTGSATVTAAGTLVATAANGFTGGGQVDRTGSITNPSWTSLSTNGTMYLFLDIAADGTCTTGSTTLAPSYIVGGTPSVTSGQFTFDYTKYIGYVGNGSAAVQTYRVFVGEVTVAANVVSAITWYALLGRYFSAYTNTLPGVGTKKSFSHNIGTDNVNAIAYFKCLTTNGNYAVGDIVQNAGIVSSAGVVAPLPTTANRLTAYFTSGAAANFQFVNATTGGGFNPTNADWAYAMTVQRNW